MLQGRQISRRSGALNVIGLPESWNLWFRKFEKLKLKKKTDIGVQKSKLAWDLKGLKFLDYNLDLHFWPPMTTVVKS